MFRPTCFPRISLVYENDEARAPIIIRLRSYSPPYPTEHSMLKNDAIFASFNGTRIVLDVPLPREGATNPFEFRVLVGRAIKYLDKSKLYELAGRSKDAILWIEAETGDPLSIYNTLMATYSTLYNFTLKSNSECKEPIIEVGVNGSKRKLYSKLAMVAEAVSRGVYIARDISNLPANYLNPSTIVQTIKRLYEYHGVRNVEISFLDYQSLTDMGFGGIVSVGEASSNKPLLVELKVGEAGKPVDFLFVGKTVVFDSGGLDLKSPQSMDEMKYDKSGGGSVAGLMATLSMISDYNAVGLLPVVENMPGPSAYKPRDVITMYDGRRVEVTNTDAEGRIILADAISYGAEKYKPKHIIDLATLTGSVVVALGKTAAGLFATDKRLKEDIVRASLVSGEKVWELPLFEEYGERLKSSVADFKNSGGREGGASIAAWFLKQFAGPHPWVHLDIAGTAWVSDNEEPKPYLPKGATGWGVETLALAVSRILDKLVGEAQD